MTPTTSTTTGSPEGFIFQRDTMGRVRVPAARREALLDEFERGGASGQAFAAMVGVRYSTFATWMQDRRRAVRARGGHAGAAALVTRSSSPATTARPVDPVRWLEAVVTEPAAAAQRSRTGAATLPVGLPGGARLDISDADQVPLVAALLRALERTKG